MNDPLLEDLDAIIRRDPAMRGLISSEDQFGPVCPSHFRRAVHALCESRWKVVIATGFFVPKGEPPAAETDGPQGAIRLAQALAAIGHEVILVTDHYCAQAIQRAAQRMGLACKISIFSEFETDHHKVQQQIETLGSWADCLIAIERIGPNRAGDCLNMRGEIVTRWTGGVHRLFEWTIKNRPDAVTIGIGDGGNEIGMGCISEDDMSRRLGSTAHIACRIATAWNIVAGTSNWGGYALAAGILALHDRLDVMHPWTCDVEEAILKEMVAKGPFVDGITRQQEPTVDGLPFLTYIQAWAAIRDRLGLSE